MQQKYIFRIRCDFFYFSLSKTHFSLFLYKLSACYILGGYNGHMADFFKEVYLEQICAAFANLLLNL